MDAGNPSTIESSGPSVGLGYEKDAPRTLGRYGRGRRRRARIYNRQPLTRTRTYPIIGRHRHTMTTLLRDFLPELTPKHRQYRKRVDPSYARLSAERTGKWPYCWSKPSLFATSSKPRRACCADISPWDHGANPRDKQDARHQSNAPNAGRASLSQTPRPH